MVLSFLCVMSLSLFASTIPAYKIIYEEKEEGTDFYIVRYTVSENFIRIDDSAEPDADASGFIIFDLKKLTIYSVSHFDKTILVIPDYKHNATNKVKSDIIYEKLEDAPTIAGKAVFNYQVLAETDHGLDKCMELQIADGLLPEVTSKLKRYQSVVSAQQLKTLSSVPAEYQTPCYLIDQIYNKGDYYDKGLPLREWHSNNRVRMLSTFAEIDVDEEVFSLPEEYKKFTLDELKH